MKAYTVHVNTAVFNDLAITDINKQTPAIGKRMPKHELLAVNLPSGSVLIAGTISSINRQAPPEIYIRGKRKRCAVDNNKRRHIIVRALRPACKSKHLPSAVAVMKIAVDVLSGRYP